MADRSDGEREAQATQFQERWKRAIPEELDFWRKVISPGVHRRYLGPIKAIFQGNSRGSYAEYARGLRLQARGGAELDRRLASLIKTSSLDSARVLDVAAGPITVLGEQIQGKRLSIFAIDALADEYNEMLKSEKICPFVRTYKCDAEKITELFAENSFDLVHIRNALDHCYDPIAVINNMLRVVKIGSAVVIWTYINEGVKGDYNGMHQWNIDSDNDDVFLWNARSKTKFTEHWGVCSDISWNKNANGEEMTCVMLKKAPWMAQNHEVLRADWSG